MWQWKGVTGGGAFAFGVVRVIAEWTERAR